MPLPLGAQPAGGRASFVTGAANAAALALLDRWPHWPGPVLALIGPPACGKSHLLAAWAAETGAVRLTGGALRAGRPHDGPPPGGPPPGGPPPGGPTHGRPVALDDADAVCGEPAAEEALFHLWNRIVPGGGTLLLAARTPPAAWPLTLADLASRLRAAPLATIGPPDEALLPALLVKLFADRGIVPEPGLLPYLTARMERSWHAAGALVAALDRASLASGRRVGVRLAAEILGAFALPPPDPDP